MPWSPDNPVIGEFEDLIPNIPPRRSSVSPSAEPAPAPLAANILSTYVEPGCYPDPNYLRAWRHLFPTIPANQPAIPATPPSTASVPPESVTTALEVPLSEGESIRVRVIPASSQDTLIAFCRPEPHPIAAPDALDSLPCPSLPPPESVTTALEVPLSEGESIRVRVIPASPQYHITTPTPCSNTASLSTQPLAPSIASQSLLSTQHSGLSTAFSSSLSTQPLAPSTASQSLLSTQH